jgi:iron-sulfur cluster assembly accessory protein
MIQISRSAIAEISRLKAKQSIPNGHFRLCVSQAGCAGLFYDMSFVEAAPTADQQYVIEGLSVLVDTASIDYFHGLAIDYTEDLMGGGFQFTNPQATRNCNCGMSFSIAADNTNEWVDCGL